MRLDKYMVSWLLFFLAAVLFIFAMSIISSTEPLVMGLGVVLFCCALITFAGAIVYGFVEKLKVK